MVYYYVKGNFDLLFYENDINYIYELFKLEKS